MTNQRAASGTRSTLLASCLMLSGCALAALPTSYERDGPPAATASVSTNLATGTVTSLDDGEFHSTTCDGLTLERRERLARIARLEAAVPAELSAIPSTVMQAVQRMGTKPEAGTSAYDELQAERWRLASNEDEAKKLNCMIDPALKAP